MVLSEAQRDRCHRTLDDVIEGFAFEQIAPGEPERRFSDAQMIAMVAMALVFGAIEGDGQARKFIVDNAAGTRRLVVEAIADRITGGHGRDY